MESALIANPARCEHWQQGPPSSRRAVCQAGVMDGPTLYDCRVNCPNHPSRRARSLQPVQITIAKRSPQEQVLDAIMQQASDRVSKRRAACQRCEHRISGFLKATNLLTIRVPCKLTHCCGGAYGSANLANDLPPGKDCLWNE